MSFRNALPPDKVTRALLREIDDRLAKLEARTVPAFYETPVVEAAAVFTSGGTTTAPYALSGSWTDTGCSQQVKVPGVYLVTGLYEFTVKAAASGWCQGRILSTGDVAVYAQGIDALLDTATVKGSGETSIGWHFREWRVPGSVKSQVSRPSGTADAWFSPYFTSLSVIRLGPPRVG